MVRSMHNQAAGAIGYTPSAVVTRNDRLMPRDLACWNPSRSLVCVIDDQGSALRAVADLYEAGFAGLDIRLVPAQEFIALDDYQRARSPFARRVSSLRGFGDEALIAAKYAAEARRGHSILIVFAPGDERMGRAQAIMARRQAHTMHYYSRWVIRGTATSRHGAFTGT